MQKNYWLINCSHTPESLDRIMMPFRKRGMLIESLTYDKVDNLTAVCKVRFEEDEVNTNRIYKNLIRLEDINTIEVLG